MNDLVKRLNARIVWWQSSNRNNREYDVTDCDLDEEVVDHIEAQNKLIDEIMFGLRIEFGPAGPSRSTPLGKMFGDWLEERRSELG